MKATVNMIDHGKDKVCGQYITWFRENFPDGGDIRDVLRTALEKHQYNIFDLWLWKYFVLMLTPVQRQKDAASKCIELCDKQTSPKAYGMFVEVGRNPLPCNVSTTISEAARYYGKVDEVMQILDEYVFA